MSAREFVTENSSNSRSRQSHLKYHPIDRAMNISVLQWKQVGPRDCFLDPIMKIEAKTIEPGKYSRHKSWADGLKNAAS